MDEKQLILRKVQLEQMRREMDNDVKGLINTKKVWTEKKQEALDKKRALYKPYEAALDEVSKRKKRVKAAMAEVKKLQDAVKEAEKEAKTRHMAYKKAKKTWESHIKHEKEYTARIKHQREHNKAWLRAKQEELDALYTSFGATMNRPPQKKYNSKNQVRRAMAQESPKAQEARKKVRRQLTPPASKMLRLPIPMASARRPSHQDLVDEEEDVLATPRPYQAVVRTTPMPPRRPLRQQIRQQFKQLQTDPIFNPL